MEFEALEAAVSIKGRNVVSLLLSKVHTRHNTSLLARPIGDTPGRNRDLEVSKQRHGQRRVPSDRQPSRVR
jgi:hypothetical protein